MSILEMMAASTKETNSVRTSNIKEKNVLFENNQQKKARQILHF